MKDLVMLVADKNMQFTLQGALSRPKALGIREITFEFRTHMGRDGGVRTSGAEALALESRRFTHALLVLDHEGSGAREAPLDLEQQLDQQLGARWGENAKAIVISPELDAWLWGNDNLLAEVFQWPSGEPPIRDWLHARKFEFGDNRKPLRPKEALEALRPIHRLPRSSALYRKVAERISLPRCTDPAFLRMAETLRRWFPGNAF